MHSWHVKNNKSWLAQYCRSTNIFGLILIVFCNVSTMVRQYFRLTFGWAGRPCFWSTAYVVSPYHCNRFCGMLHLGVLNKKLGFCHNAHTTQTTAIHVNVLKHVKWIDLSYSNEFDIYLLYVCTRAIVIICKGKYMGPLSWVYNYRLMISWFIYIW